MKTKFLSIGLLILLIGFGISCDPIEEEEIDSTDFFISDKVDFVYPNGNDVVIWMKNAGPCVVQENIVGRKTTDRIHALALTLLNSGKKVCYPDAARISYDGWDSVPIKDLIAKYEQYGQ